MAKKTEEKAEKGDTKRKDDNVVLIGKKPSMAYVLAVITQFNERNVKEVNVKARGRAISTAVDVAEIVRNRFLKEAKVKEIKIGTDRVKTREGSEMNVSSIRICLAK